MSDPLLTGLRDAVATAIRAAGINENIDAPTGQVLPRYEKTDFSGKIACDALIRPLSGEVLNREAAEYTTAIDVVVQNCFDSYSVVDGLVLTCEEITGLFINQPLEYAGHEAICIGIEYQGYDRDKLREKHFGAVISLEFTVYKS